MHKLCILPCISSASSKEQTYSREKTFVVLGYMTCFNSEERIPKTRNNLSFRDIIAKIARVTEII